MRTNVVEVMGQGFTYYQKVVGLPKTKRLLNIAKHSSLPVITLYPVSMTRAIGGLVLIELVFNWPGVGFLLIQAVEQRDVPVLMFIFVLVATFIVVANFLVDIIYGIIDPRVRISSDD
jgi:peptide/nickel transport system permease protein